PIMQAAPEGIKTYHNDLMTYIREHIASPSSPAAAYAISSGEEDSGTEGVGTNDGDSKGGEESEEEEEVEEEVEVEEEEMIVDGKVNGTSGPSITVTAPAGGEGGSGLTHPLEKEMEAWRKEDEAQRRRTGHHGLRQRHQGGRTPMEELLDQTRKEEDESAARGSSSSKKAKTLPHIIVPGNPILDALFGFSFSDTPATLTASSDAQRQQQTMIQQQRLKERDEFYAALRIVGRQLARSPLAICVVVGMLVGVWVLVALIVWSMVAVWRLEGVLGDMAGVRCANAGL
ncbi:hypothetical protein HK102_004247, partial [Quaeritorhiza haematococci]